MNGGRWRIPWTFPFLFASLLEEYMPHPSAYIGNVQAVWLLISKKIFFIFYVFSVFSVFSDITLRDYKVDSLKSFMEDKEKVIDKAITLSPIKP